MEAFHTRTQMLLGGQGIEKLKNAHVALFGLGGVGGFAAEALARAGVGSFDLIDHDVVAESNINRQIIATVKTIGRNKAEVMKERIMEINPRAKVTARPVFYLPETAWQFDFSRYSYVIDAIDTVTAKIDLILQAKAQGVPVISAMGAGNKLDPSLLRVGDIYETKGCPLARVMRRELRKRGVEQLKVVYSTEKAIKPLADFAGADPAENPRPVPGSVSFVPSVAGLYLAWQVIMDLSGLSSGLNQDKEFDDE